MKPWIPSEIIVSRIVVSFFHKFEMEKRLEHDARTFETCLNWIFPIDRFESFVSPCTGTRSWESSKLLRDHDDHSGEAFVRSRSELDTRWNLTLNFLKVCFFFSDLSIEVFSKKCLVITFFLFDDETKNC